LSSGAGHRFLHSTPTLSKRVLGDYLGHKNNESVLRAFVRQFDFGGRRIDEALRMMLESFRLPGESQMIERVMNSFAAVYMTTAPPEIKHEDAAFVLSYSIVMLNTDQVRDAQAERTRVPLRWLCLTPREPYSSPAAEPPAQPSSSASDEVGGLCTKQPRHQPGRGLSAPVSGGHLQCNQAV